MGIANLQMLAGGVHPMRSSPDDRSPATMEQSLPQSTASPTQLPTTQNFVIVQYPDGSNDSNSREFDIPGMGLIFILILCCFGSMACLCCARFCEKWKQWSSCQVKLESAHPGDIVEELTVVGRPVNDNIQNATTGSCLSTGEKAEQPFVSGMPVLPPAWFPPLRAWDENTKVEEVP